MNGLNRDDILRMAREVAGVTYPAGVAGVKIGMSEEHLEHFAALVAAAEREACAEACNDAVGSASMYDSPDSAKFAYGIKNHCQELIRARGNDAA
jgi:hypothetical protein